jgi:ATP-dependent protease ClpP protease subunit
MNGLFDMQGRTVGLNGGAINAVESLLRLQNTKDFKRPITLYILSDPQTPLLSFGEALLLCDTILALQSPVRTIGLGILDAMQALILASGTDKRLLLPHALVEIRDLSAHGLGLKKAIGLPGPLRESPGAAQEYFERLLKRLNLSREAFAVQQTLSAEAAVTHGIADSVYHAVRPQTLRQEPQYESIK